MKIITSSVNQVVNSVPFEKHQFGIKSKNLHYIIGLLRNDLYSDKLLAIIREYACNAQDANVEAGRAKTPIKITLPTKLSQELKIRDYGCGLSKEEVMDTFISYGESTKRNTNAQVGQMGIGSKSAFCYGDSFRVTSYNNGIKTVYDCVLDKNDVGDCLVLLTEPMKPTEKEGIEITINVKKDDVDVLREKALWFFKFWDTCPEIVGFTKDELLKQFTEKDKVQFSGTDWTIYSSGGSDRYSYNRSQEKGHAVMGNIAYPINWENIRFESINADDFKVTKNVFDSLLEYFKTAKLVLKLKIGEVQFAPSRESLQYTDYTNKAIVSKICVMLAEIQKCIQDKIAKSKTLNEAYCFYGETFDYYSGLNSIAPYFKGKLFWNNIAINNANLEGLNCFDAVQGYNKNGWYSQGSGEWQPIHQSFSTNRGDLRKDTRHNREFSFNKSTKLMVYDTEKKSYIRKAVHYIHNQDSTNIKKIVVFRFANKAARDIAFKMLNLDQLEMIKYSDIHDAVKKTIVRAGKNTKQTKDSSVRECKSVNPASHATSWHSFKSYRDWNNTTVDLSTDEGYYIPLENNEPKFAAGSTIGHMNALCSFVEQYNKRFTTNKIDKIYGFGIRVTGNKLFDTKKWVNVETYIEDQLTQYLTDDKFNYYISWVHILKNNSWALTPAFLTKLVDKLSKKNTEFHKLLDISTKMMFSAACNTDTGDNIYEIISRTSKLMTQVTKSSQYKEIKELVEEISIKYPLLQQCDDFRSGERRLSTKSWKPYTDYIDAMS
jgi:hypothetical protein